MIYEISAFALACNREHQSRTQEAKELAIAMLQEIASGAGIKIEAVQ